MKLKFFAIVFLFLSFICPYLYPQDFKFLPLGHLEVLGTYSDIKDGNDLSGYDIFGYYSPTLRFNKTLYLIPLYTLEYKRLRQFISEEEGVVQYNTYMVHNFTLGLRKEFKKDWFIKFSALGTWNYVKETKDETWGQGLYDYRDAGCSIDLRHKKRNEQSLENYTLGFEYFRRIYPNFQSLLSIGMPSAPEKNEKDFDGFKFSFGFDRLTSSGSQVYIKPYFLLKYFIDKHLINKDGTLDLGNKRKDRMFNLDYGFKIPLKGKLSLGMDNNFIYNQSNLGYYDSRNTLILTDDIFTPHYYSYYSSSLYPYLEYIYPLEEGKNIKMKIGYSFLYRYYPERKAQTEDGTYSEKDERDLEHSLLTSLSWPLTKNIDFLARYSYTWARSSQKYEQFYRYKYDTYLIEAGISFDF